MLGLWEYKDNRLQLYLGCGWNTNRPLPELVSWDNRGPGVAGPHGIAYSCGWLTAYGRRLTNPVLGRYQKYDNESREWVGRHRADG